MILQSDVLVIGSGIAGLFYTLSIADERKVILVTKKQTFESNTNYAQGGIASVLGSDDSYDLHIQDTLNAGDGLCNREIVEMVIRSGPEAVKRLIEYGVRFTIEKDQLDLGREGGHSRNRIVHALDLTGREIEYALVSQVRHHPNVTLLENHMAVDLITNRNLLDKGSAPMNGCCWGAYVLDNENHVVKTCVASTTVLATGGCGMVYRHSTNPSIATGDGIAMAHRAGAAIANMEFIQFHPTTLYHPSARSFLISEALRGAGAVLRNKSGERFMPHYDRRQELAPRDIVARAIDAELKKRGDDCVYLDMTHRSSDEIRNAFPNIYEKCLSVGIDIAHQRIPVVPAAHYCCGGVVSDADAHSTLEGLLVVGEVSMTGLHGANRLASNSLLEAVVFARRAAETTLRSKPMTPPVDRVRQWDESGTDNSEEWILISHNRRELQSLMWDYVGIVRSTLRLERAHRRVVLLFDEVDRFYKKTRINEELLELRNLTLAGRLIIESALLRKESRGLHYTTDYPASDEKYGRDTVRSKTTGWMNI